MSVEGGLDRVGGSHVIPPEHVTDAVSAAGAIALHVEAVLKRLSASGADLETLALTIAQPRLGLRAERRAGEGSLVVNFSARLLPPERRVT